MVIVCVLFAIIIVFLSREILRGRREFTPVIIFLLLGFSMSMLGVLLNSNNPVPFSETSDAQTYLLRGEALYRGSLDVLSYNHQYWGYYFTLAALYATSTGWFFYVLSASLLNFIAFAVLYIVLIEWYAKNIKQSMSPMYWYVIFFNPGVFLVGIASTRDSLITLLTVVSIVSAYNQIFGQRNIASVLLFISSTTALVFFRTNLVYIIILATISGAIFKFMVKKRFWLILILSLAFFFIALVVSPLRFVRSLVVLTGGDIEYVSELTNFGEGYILSVGEAYSAGRAELLEIAASRFVKRSPISFLGRSFLKGAYLALSDLSSGFYESNLLRTLLSVLSDIYRYWVVIVLFFGTLLFLNLEELKPDLKTLLFVSLSTYVMVWASYTIKFGSWQLRNRLPVEILVVFVFLVSAKCSRLQVRRLVPIWYLSNLLALSYIIVKPF